MKNLPALPRSGRREFLRHGLQGAGLLALGHFSPKLLAGSAAPPSPATENDRNILVLVQLAGGNDGLNTVVPFADPLYHRLRPGLALHESALLRLNETVALHGACAGLHALFQDGKLAIAQNVGYANPNRSHLRATEIWETATDGQRYLPTHWLDRRFNPSGPPASTGADPAWIKLPDNIPFDAALRRVAASIGAGSSTRAYRVALAGFDTHRNQADAHAEALATASAGLALFQANLESQGLADRVLTVVFSEFGRRAAENEYGGTDHGTAGPVFVVGARIRPGLFGRASDLPLEPNQDLRHSTDFRQIYSTVITRWLGGDATAVLGDNYPALNFI